MTYWRPSSAAAGLKLILSECHAKGEHVSTALIRKGRWARSGAGEAQQTVCSEASALQRSSPKPRRTVSSCPLRKRRERGDVYSSQAQEAMSGTNSEPKEPPKLAILEPGSQPFLPWHWSLGGSFLGTSSRVFSNLRSDDFQCGLAQGDARQGL